MILTWVWVYRYALKEHTGGSIAEWSIHNIGVSRDPANVCHTAKYVSLIVVKHKLQHTQ